MRKPAPAWRPTSTTWKPSPLAGRLLYGVLNGEAVMIHRVLPMVLFFLLLVDVLCATFALGDDRQPLNSTGNGISSYAGDVGTLPRVARQSDHCPFNFQDGMAPGVFCVYEGVAIGPDGRGCRDRVIAIWTRLAPGLNANKEGATDSSDVHFGFITSPDLVMRAVVDADTDSHAAIVGYTLGDGQAPVRIRGTGELRFVPTGGGEGREVLSLLIDQPEPTPAACAFTSYRGAFAGVMTLPADASLHPREAARMPAGPLAETREP